MRAILLHSGFEVYGDGTQVRDYVHVADVVAAVKLGLADPAWSGPTVIGSGRSLSVLEVRRGRARRHRHHPRGHATAPLGPARCRPSSSTPPGPGRGLGAAVQLRGRRGRGLARMVRRSIPTRSPRGMAPSAWPRRSGPHEHLRHPATTRRLSRPPLAQTRWPTCATRSAAAVAAFLRRAPGRDGAPVAVVVPAYNEAPTVAAVVARDPATSWLGWPRGDRRRRRRRPMAPPRRRHQRRRARLRRPGQPWPGRSAAPRLLAGPRSRRPT